MHKLEKDINDLTKNILADFEGSRTIDEVKAYDHPDNEIIVNIIESLRRIIFPGYFRNKSYRVYTVRNNISMILEDVIFKLIKQISIVLRYDEKYVMLGDEEITDNAERITFEFLNKLPKIRELIETDVQAAYDGDPAAYNKDEIIYSYPGLYAILVNRLAHELFLLGVPLIPRVMTEHAHSKTGIDIHPGATIGRYFFIDHGTGIVIGETTEIGDNVKVYQGVTLGALSTRGGQSLRNKKRHPTIEDNVTIYSGASILGGETVVGKDAVIGGNAFITRSVPAGAKVSIKNQELRYNFDSPVDQVKKADLDPEESWFYII
ncbi:MULTISPECIES: serine O-acetyltransferase EpsC [Ruminococcus]|jgi:serine O-acetyltransferase|uniref:Serine O-acetyltransferase n=1 Tax=Ruminococcus flavefaciens TaxID=1265 RepID=A0A315XUY6_RUMFL|nr:MULTISPECIES: serine O-acetyltransferase EpsC [Ruminococcus]MBQ6169215.1 serine acetyltransferase [Ruminococcus sp.]MBR1432404.1 serine acetyltransferase [Ruminococcus sp.]PWJ10823.1 serine O-acetyltransferase [Ruminococcus flavefaciens]SSA51401.1 serine O-acetyltransferase [Ruminococcus flavefaciens]